MTALLTGPTVGAALWRFAIAPESDFTTYLVAPLERARYRVGDLRDALAFVDAEIRPEDVPVFELKPKSTSRIRAKIRVRPGRLRFVVPEGLAEGD